MPALVLGLTLLVLLTALTMMWAAMGQLRDTAQRQAQARAQLMVDALALRVQRAVTLGIPLERLEGVEDLFEQRMQDLPDVAALALRDATGKALWLRARGPADVLPPGPQVVAGVTLAGRVVAEVVLVWREPGIANLLLRWALPLAALAIGLAALAAEAIRWTWATGAAAREQLVRAAARRIGQGDFTVRTARRKRREFDGRLPWIARELRYVNELHLRVQRLVESLRKTEPDAARRDALDQALRDATGTDGFRGAAMPPALQPVGEPQARRRWRGVAAGVGAWIVAGVAVAAAPPLSPAATWALMGGGAAVVAALAWLAGRTGTPAMSGRGLWPGLLVVGPALVLPSLLAIAPDVYFRLGAAAQWLMGWGIAAGVAQVLAAARGPRVREADDAA